MRKLLVGFVFSALCLAFSSMPAHAQTVVQLDVSSGLVVFTGGATIGTTDTVKATINGTGSAHSGANLYTYTLASGPILLTETSSTTPVGGSNLYTASATPVSITLTPSVLTPLAGSLTGTLDVLTFLQTGGLGGFNDSLTANVNVLTSTGPLASNGGVFILGLSFGSTTQVDTHNKTISNNGGFGTLTTTPEPASMLLFGSGLLAIGGALRRRLLVSA